MKIKNRSHGYDKNKPRPRHEYKYSKYKKCLSMVILICIKLKLSTIWSSIYEKVKQHWGYVEKNIAYKKRDTRMWLLGIVHYNTKGKNKQIKLKF